MRPSIYFLVTSLLWGTALGSCYAGTPPYNATCDGSRASIGMTISVIQRQGSATKHAVSLVELSAIVKSHDVGRPIAWLGIDNAGSRWIEFGRNAKKLRTALGSSVKEFDGGVFDLWASGVLPNGYQVVTCAGGTAT